MIKQHCDRCEQEVNSGILEGYSELDKLANDSGDSYRFHITAVSKLLCSNCFDAMLLNALGLELSKQAKEPEAEQETEQEEDLRESGREQEETVRKEIEREERHWSEKEAEEEPKPQKKGHYMGQLSPRGQWTWAGAGGLSDDWQQVT